MDMRCLWSLGIVVIEIVRYASAASNPLVDQGSFCYDQAMCAQSTWGGDCNTGKSQSPIDIQLRLFKPHWAPVTAFDLNKSYSTTATHAFYGQNNGHTVQFDLSPNLGALTSDLEIDGGKLPAKYTFAQLHFHWAQTDRLGSEHQVNGHSYPLELHVVHYKSSYDSLADALSATHQDKEAVAVMGIFFDVSHKTNKALQPIVDALPELEDKGMLKLFNLSLRISKLYPERLEFARYHGSLTTPGCDEKVIWTVFLWPAKISRTQMDAFRLLTNEELLSSFNYRTPQPLNGRQVLFYKGFFALPPFLAVFNPAKYFLNFLLNFFQTTFNYLKPNLVIL